MKKGDFFIFGIILLAAAVLFAVFKPEGTGKNVVIKENGELICSIPLSENKTVELSGNTIEISEGEVKMKSADCKNQICVHHAPISRHGETILCAPNGVTVTVE